MLTKQAFWDGAVRGVGLGNMAGGFFALMYVVGHQMSNWLLIICIMAMLGGCILYVQEK